ncbi:LuxR C-terminal-related transcriptional regulator [Actinoplanes sp. L3-i22]|uniref:helix-turn-helix transcriptional regulator n=1 Tax=Actinoplanes sp. L3-i22 TaxID=2836373 RepID=UPI001C7609E5|nr:LuxR C-terminal-related transcriptional regulator [Actinoplanes sp. L3-i22]BCY08850.1 hypothetical protein L3i22_039380 [Actinoplanes sp. L3-i22]
MHSLDEDTPGVIVGLRNELRRAGLGRMLDSVGGSGSYRLIGSLHQAIDAAAAIASAILIIALGELDPADLALLIPLASSVRILTLVDDTELHLLGPLAGRSTGVLPLADLDTETLRDAVRRAERGEFSMPQRIAVKLVAQHRPAGTPTPLPRMTTREEQAAQLLVDGLTNKQIARRLGISEHGAKRLLANVMAKLDCPNRTLAVAKLLQDRSPEPALQH